MYELKEKEIHKPEGIVCKYFMPDPVSTQGTDVLILSVNGVYPDGSLGNEHAAYIAVMAIQGLQAFNPEAFILDLSDLEYRWGNSILGVFQDVSRFMDADKEENEPYFPVFAVTSEKSTAGFLSLITPSNESPPEWHFKDINQAIEKAASAGKAWIEF